MVFEYTPTSDTLVESFWSFSIPSQGLVVPFLLVGHVTEPRVTLDRPAINFGRVRLRKPVMCCASYCLVSHKVLGIDIRLDG